MFRQTQIQFLFLHILLPHQPLLDLMLKQVNYLHQQLLQLLYPVPPHHDQPYLLNMNKSLPQLLQLLLPLIQSLQHQ